MKPSNATCPFCATPWTDAMLEQLDRVTLPSNCACCSGPHVPAAVPVVPATEDICCVACGHAIFRAIGGQKT